MEKVKNAAYQNPALTVSERVEDLLSRMTVEEKVAQIGCVLAAMGRFRGDMTTMLKHGIGQIGTLGGCFSADMNIEFVKTVQDYLLENTRLGIPAMFHLETLNGAQIAGGTTFPIPIGMGASWDDKLLGEVTAAIREETSTSGFRLALAPVLDVSRDPRWGRQGETYGENATLTSAMGAAYVKGLQGDSLTEGVAATTKHFLGYGMSEGGINIAASHINARELREVYAKPFEAAIRLSGLEGVMNAYQEIDGVPVAAAKEILTDILRGELGFKGLTVSDYGSIEKSVICFGLTEDMTEAGILSINAGLDTETPERLCYGDDFTEAVKSGRVDASIVDRAVRRVLTLKFKLGLFETPYANAERHKSALQCDAHIKTSYEMACKSFVLLKNENNILPLSDKYKKIAVIGKNAESLRNLFGGYSYIATYEMMHSFMTRSMEGGGLEGVVLTEEQLEQQKAIAARMPSVEQSIKLNYPGIQSVYQAVCEGFPDAEVRYARGCGVYSDDRAGFDEAVKLAGESEVVILVLGGKNGSGNGCTMGENVDSSDIGLPGVQEELAKAVAATGKSIIIVHMDGRPLSSVWASENAAAILEVWHPSQCGAKAIADTLRGINNPGGKLPVTVARNAGHIPIYADQRRGSGALYKGISNSGITQGYYNEPGFPLYAFGFGLSYSDFEIGSMELSANEIKPDEKINVSCTVKNIGAVAGDEVVQLYFTDRVASIVRPNKELAGFARVCLKSGESKKITFTFHADQTAFVGADMKWRVEAGDIDLMIGNSSDNLALKAVLNISETKVLRSSERTFFSEVEYEQL